MPGKVILRYKDYAGQSSTFEFWTDDVTNANLNTISSQMGAVITAGDLIGLGELNVSQLVAEVDEVTTAKSSNPSSRRELKWLLTFVDTVDGHTETKEFPCVNTTDGTLFAAGDGELADMSDASWVSFKSAIEAIIKSNQGNAMTLSYARVVGRNI